MEHDGYSDMKSRSATWEIPVIGTYAISVWGLRRHKPITFQITGRFRSSVRVYRIRTLWHRQSDIFYTNPFGVRIQLNIYCQL